MTIGKVLLLICTLPAIQLCMSDPVSTAVCSNSGRQAADGSCICDRPFTGTKCEALDFGVPHQGSGTPGVFASASGFFEVDGVKQATWGGSPVRDHQGTYHLFFSWFKPSGSSTSASLQSWYKTSVVAHATSSHPDYNYTFKSVVLPPRGRMFFDGSTTHNPTITRLADGSYALYYIGLNCENYTTDADPCVEHQWIGAAHAKDLNGPWERLEHPVLTGDKNTWEGGMVANPSVLDLENGTLLMAYRGLNDRGVGMASSTHWSGPFHRLNGGAAVLGPESPAATAVLEDMSIWKAERGLQMVLHQEKEGTHVGAHAFSTDDGLSWTIAGTAYNLSVAISEKASLTYVRRERPQFLYENGHPTYLFSGVLSSDRSNPLSQTIAVPLAAGPSSDTSLVTSIVV